MEIASKSPLRGRLSSRTGSLVIAGLVAAVAAMLVFAALHSARKTSGAAATTSVVVAGQLIPKGSSGEAIASEQSFRVTDVRGDVVLGGAITDISQVRGKVATDDIYPGQQLTAAEFTSSGGALATRLARRQRAITLPIDTAHGMVGQVSAGDRVDVLAGFNVDSAAGRSRPVMRALASGVTVLKAPKSSSGAGSANNSVVTLRVRDSIATQLAFAADNGKIWIVLRPGGSADAASPDVVTVRNLMFGVKSVPGE